MRITLRRIPALLCQSGKASIKVSARRRSTSVKSRMKAARTNPGEEQSGRCPATQIHTTAQQRDRTPRVERQLMLESPQ
jgi:hypothetical protein